MTKKDQLRIGAEIAPNTRLVERRNGGRRSVATLTPLVHGRPIPEGSELVRVTPGEDEWHDVETIYRHDPRAELSGPPQVATPAYKDGYDRIFGKKQKVGLA